MKTMKHSFISAITIIAVLLSLSGMHNLGQVAAASEQSAITTYKDYLAKSHTIESWSGDLSWGTKDICYAELVDFDNDGVPEMLLVVNVTHPASMHYYERKVPHVVVVGYAGSAKMLWSREMGYDAGDFFSVELAAGPDGRKYIVRCDTYLGHEPEREYLALRSGVFVEIGPTVPNATRIRTMWEATNNVQAFLSELGNKTSSTAISVQLDGRSLSFDVPPQIVGGRTLVPLRAIFEALGASVDWAAATQTVTATNGETVVVLTIGGTSPQVNGQVITIDQPGIVVEGRILVPLRFVAESFGVSVDWDTATRAVTIKS